MKMKWFGTLALSLGFGLMTTAFAQEAHARLRWEVVQRSSSEPRFIAATGVSSGIWGLSKTKVGNDYQIMKMTSNGFVKDGNAAATSITSSPRHTVWVSDAASTVWSKPLNATRWTGLSMKACEGTGAAIKIRQAIGDNSIAAGVRGTVDQVYVVSDGTTRWFNGNCWFLMPKLPSGKAVEVAVSPEQISGTFDFPYAWVQSDNGTIYRWNGSAWVKITTGTAAGMGFNYIVGSDNASVWHYDFANDTFKSLSDWTFGTITQIGFTNDGFQSNVVVVPNGDIYRRVNLSLVRLSSIEGLDFPPGPRSRY